MKLTTATTESDLMVPAALIRARIADLAATCSQGPDGWAPSRDLHSAVQDLYAAEAVARARYQIVQVLVGTESWTTLKRDAALLKCFTGILEVGADDEWSGRGNDARRAAFDAVRKVIADARWDLVSA